MKEKFSKFPFSKEEIEKIERLPTLTQSILLFIVENIKDEKALITSRKILAEHCGKSISSVKRSIVQLRKSNLIKTYQSGGFSMYIPCYSFSDLNSKMNEKKKFLSINAVFLLDEKEWSVND